MCFKIFGLSVAKIKLEKVTRLGPNRVKSNRPIVACDSCERCLNPSTKIFGTLKIHWRFDVPICCQVSTANEREIQNGEVRFI